MIIYFRGYKLGNLDIRWLGNLLMTLIFQYQPFGHMCSRIENFGEVQLTYKYSNRLKFGNYTLIIQEFYKKK